MSADYDWKEEYSIGIEEIDIQHKRLLGVIRSLHQLTESGAEETRVNALLEELENTFQFHFGSEESLMAMYQFPFLSEHRMQHELMTRNVKRLVGEAKHNGIFLPQLLFNLENWFIDHDNDYDKEFGKYVVHIRNNL